MAYLTFTNDSSHWLRPQQHLHLHLYLYLYLLRKTCTIEEGTEKLVTRQRSLLSCKCTSFLSRPPPVHARSRKADIETSFLNKNIRAKTHRLGFSRAAVHDVGAATYSRTADHFVVDCGSFGTLLPIACADAGSAPRDDACQHTTIRSILSARAEVCHSKASAWFLAGSFRTGPGGSIAGPAFPLSGHALRWSCGTFIRKPIQVLRCAGHAAPV